MAEFPAYIRAMVGALEPEDRDYIGNKLRTRLGKFARSVERVSVRIDDANGPKGGVDQVCRIKVVLAGRPSVVVESRDVSLKVATDRALAGVVRAVGRVVKRRRMKPLRRAA